MRQPQRHGGDRARGAERAERRRSRACTTFWNRTGSLLAFATQSPAMRSQLSSARTYALAALVRRCLDDSGGHPDVEQLGAAEAATTTPVTVAVDHYAAFATAATPVRVAEEERDWFSSGSTNACSSGGPSWTGGWPASPQTSTKSQRDLG